MKSDAHEGGQSERRIILIVEDHDGVRQLLRTWLGDAFPGVRVLDVASGEEAVAFATAEHPDLVLMDIQLPRMDGIEATRRVKAVAPRTRVVMLTSLDDKALREAASAAGASAYVSKRSMRSELIPVIEAFRTPPDADDHPESGVGSGANNNPTGLNRR